MTRKSTKSAGSNVVWDSGDDGTPGALRSPPHGYPDTPPIAIVHAVPAFICWCGRPPTASSVPE